MDSPMSNLGFQIMSLTFRIRDLLAPPERGLSEAEIRPGFCILDYGCGPGSYSIPAAELVGEWGRVYSLDIHPLAIRRVQKTVSKRRLTNIEAIRSDCATGLPDQSVDMVLLYDVFHDLSRPDDVLREIYRVLKPDGVLSFSDHHLKEEEIVLRITVAGLFRLLRKNSKTYSFRKTG